MLPERQPTRFLYFATAAAEFLQSGVAVIGSGVMSGQQKCAPRWAFPSAADASPTTRAKSGSDPSGRFDQGNLVVGEAVELIDARIYLLVNGIYLTPDEALFRLQLGRGKLPMQGEH